MSGHSKFANIKHKKERNDAAGRVFVLRRIERGERERCGEDDRRGSGGDEGDGQ